MKQPHEDLAARDRGVIELGAPGHMLVLMAQEAAKKGWTMRSDAVHRLNMAAAAPMANLDPFSIRRLAQKIDDVATTLLNDLNPDDPRDGLYCCAKFALLLVDEGRYPDPRNNAVLVSLLLLDDIRDAKPDEAGQLAVWRLDENRWTREAKKLIQRANFMGYYMREGLCDMQLIA